MRVRVFDKEANNYFVSEVYAIINLGYYEKYLVVKKVGNSRYFKLFDYLDKTEGGPVYPVNINIISSNELPEPWVNKTESELKYFHNELGTVNKNNSIYSFRGYAFILEQKEQLLALFKGNEIAYEKIRGNKIAISTKLFGWNYVESETDIQNLMEEFGGFHDSVLRNLNYISGSGRTNEGMMVSDSIRQVSMIFDSDWSDSIEIVFEGVLALNLRPAKDNYSSDLYSATIMLKDETIFYYDDEVESEQKNYVGTWVHALGMRWRYLS